MNRLSPILIRAFGRSGTTLLMQLFATSDRVAVERRYPYEDRFLTYFCRLSHVLDAERKEADPPWNDHEVNLVSPSYVGALPYLPTDLFEVAELKKRFLIAMWHQFSESVNGKRQREHPGKPELVYYVEKIAFDVMPIVNRSLQGVRNISVVRDPRGEMASIINFNLKRGFKGFGWREDDTEITFALRLIKGRATFFRNLNKLRKRDDPGHMVLRYEDLVVNGHDVAAALTRWLGIELSMEQVEADRHAFAHHVTTSSGRDSIDAWRKVLPEEVQKLFAKSMSDELQLFDYPTE